MHDHVAKLLTKCQPEPDPEHLRPGMPGQRESGGHTSAASFTACRACPHTGRSAGPARTCALPQRLSHSRKSRRSRGRAGGAGGRRGRGRVGAGASWPPARSGGSSARAALFVPHSSATCRGGGRSAPAHTAHYSQITRMSTTTSPSGSRTTTMTSRPRCWCVAGPLTITNGWMARFCSLGRVVSDTLSQL